MNKNIKRAIGTEKIFLYSCGAVIAAAAAVWLIVNGAFALYVAGEGHVYIKYSSDAATSVILLLASAFTYYRYGKICAANNASRALKLRAFSLMSALVSAIFAAADLMFTKLVLQRVHGDTVSTWLEEECGYSTTSMYDRLGMLEEAPSYTAGRLLILFAATTVYYYCFCVIGLYLMQCYVCRQRKILVYTAATAAIIPVILIYYSEIDAFIESLTMASSLPDALRFFTALLKMISLLMILVGFFSNPILVVFWITSGLPNEINSGNTETIILVIILLAVFILFMLIFTAFAEKAQYPDKKRIKKTLENYTKKGER